MNIDIKVRIDQLHISLSLNSDVQVEELLEYLQDCSYIQRGNQWTCYSQKRASFLDFQQQIGEFPYDTLTFSKEQQIYTSDYSMMFKSSQFYNMYRSITERTQNSQLHDSHLNIITDKIEFRVQFGDATIYLETSYQVRVEEILEELTSLFGILDQLNEFEFYSELRQHVLQSDEIIDQYANETLILQKKKYYQHISQDYIKNNQSLTVYYKLDYKDLHQIEVNTTTTINMLLSSIQNLKRMPGNIQEWTCYSEKRGCYLRLDEDFGNYPNDVLLIATLNKVKCYQLAKFLEQAKKQIQDKFEKLKQSYLQELQEKEKQLTDLLFKDYQNIFQMAFSPDTIENTFKLNQYIVDKNQNNNLIKTIMQDFDEICGDHKLQIKTLELAKYKFNPKLLLSVDKSATGIELSNFLEQWLNLSEKIQKNFNNFEYHSLTQSKKINKFKSFKTEIKDYDSVIIGPCFLNFISNQEDTFEVVVQIWDRK